MVRLISGFHTLIKSARRAGTPLLAVRTADPASAMAHVSDCISNGGKSDNTPIFAWDILTGLAPRNKAGKEIAAQVYPAEGGHQQTLPGDIQTLGGTLRQAGQFDEALQLFAEVETLAAEQVRLRPNNQEFRILLAQNRGQVALVHMDRKNYWQAEVEFAAACARYREIEKLRPVGLAGVRGLNRCTSWLALAQKRSGKLAVAEATAKRAIESTEALLKANPGSGELIEELRIIRLRALQ